jgi:beta-galactosidase
VCTQLIIIILQGILGNVTLQMWLEPYYQELTTWTVTGYPLENYTDIQNYLTAATTDTYALPKNGILTEGPVVFHAEFDVTVEEIFDTYFDTTNWGKGIMYVNGIHIGRYWPLAGPQMTMYIPKDLLKSGTNVIVIIEYQKAPLDGLVTFTDTPQLD